MLSDKISATELIRKFIKSALLVGSTVYTPSMTTQLWSGLGHRFDRFGPRGLVTYLDVKAVTLVATPEPDQSPDTLWSSGNYTVV